MNNKLRVTASALAIFGILTINGCSFYTTVDNVLQKRKPVTEFGYTEIIDKDGNLNAPGTFVTTEPVESLNPSEDLSPLPTINPNENLPVSTESPVFIDDEVTNVDEEEFVEDVENEEEEIIEEPIIEEVEEEVVTLEPITSMIGGFTVTECVVATTDVNIRRGPGLDFEAIDILEGGDYLYFLEDCGEWTKVIFNGEEAYCYTSYLRRYRDVKIPEGLKYNNLAYINQDTELYDEEGNVLTAIPRLEVVEIYEDNNGQLLVKFEGGVGYIYDYSATGLEDVAVVTDISDQHTRLYVNQELIMDAGVVTGKPNNDTDLGVFRIYAKQLHRHLKGDGPNPSDKYDVYVDVFLPYNGGEGFHDANYASLPEDVICLDGHHHPAGYKHGWRPDSVFGNPTYYLTGGSHGCTNMLNKDVHTLYEYCDIGTQVIVKK